VPSIVIEVCGEPKAKGRPRFSRKTGVAYTPAGTRSYENLLRAAGQDAMKGEPPLICAVTLRMAAIMSVPTSWSQKKQKLALGGAIRPTTRPDADNLLKTVSDALNGVVLRDDKQIVDVHVSKHYGTRPLVRVEIERIPGSPG
jgi:Holliday junction resolvase RusA-like endonuclease